MTKQLVLVLALVACGGANLNRRTSGNVEGGVAVEHGEIAVEQRGRWIIVRDGDKLLVGDVASRQLTELPIGAVDRLAFWTRGDGVFGVTRDRRLVSYDLAAGRVAWQRPLLEQPAGLDVTEAARVILTDTMTSVGGIVAPHGITVLDATSGDIVKRFDAGGPIEDVDLTPDGSRVIVTRRETWTKDRPETTIHVVSTATGDALCTARVPNCSDELIVDRDGERAYLAPTTCRRDPVSIVNITAACAFEVNLPGFGPIALTPDGTTGIAFLDRDARDPTAPPRPAEVDRSDQRYHLMMFDTTTHALRTVPVGNEMPRYAMTPDGRELVLDGLRDLKGEAASMQLVPRPVRIVGVDDGSLRATTGPNVMLNAYVTAPGEIWLVHFSTLAKQGTELAPRDHGLYRIDLATSAIEHVPLPFEPLAINALPDHTLVLRAADGVHLFDRATRTHAPFTACCTSRTP